MSALAKSDPEIFGWIKKEGERQAETIELIASENFVSQAVLEANGSDLTNKYGEGYSGKRYYGGCEFVDHIERLAISRVLELFGADHANVQPHSGANANMAAYMALLEPKDRVLGMRLDQGGHLTHGSSVNFSGKLYDFASYGVSSEDGRIQYEDIARLAREFQPRLIVAGASSYPRTIDFERIADIARASGALFMVDMAHIAGLVAAGLHPSPIPHADVVTSTTHKTLRGVRGGFILCKAEYAKKIDSAVFPGTQGGPLLHSIAAKAVSFGEALKPDFKAYQQRVLDNAQALSQALIERGLDLVSGGTDNHLLLVDVRKKATSGREVEAILGGIGIIVNKNKIPFDPLSAALTSGIRLGTPAVTTRGMGIAEMKEIARLIVGALESKEDPTRLKALKGECLALIKGFPLHH